MFSSSWNCTYINRSSSYQFDFSLSLSQDSPCIDRSSSCLFEFESGPHLYRSVIHPVSLSFWGHTYINQSFSCQFEFEFSGLHLYRSIIFRVSLNIRGRTYIDRSFLISAQFEFFGIAPISIGHSSSRFEFLFFETVPISISHYLISWVESVWLWATLYPPFEFTTHISVMLLGTPCLAFSCGSHRVVSFEHILSYTPRWFDRYSSLTSTYESLLETS